MKSHLYFATVLFATILSVHVAFATNTCYSSAQTIPVTCSGGTIMSDTWNGCRQVTCANGGNSITGLACDKPDAGTKQYFEVYRQGSSGVAPTLCFDGACVGSNGYAKSSTFPICTQPTTNTCASSVKDVPANCAGTITSDTTSGSCRTITCANGNNNVKVLACDKPDTGSKQYFEMYKQSSTGVAPKLCLNGACISANGYAKSTNYPICSQTNSTGNQTGNQTNSTGNSTGGSASMSVSVAPYYPKGNDYVFNCDATGYTPTSYDITFGDGQKLVNTQQRSYYHTYTEAGNFTVVCTGKDAMISRTGIIVIDPVDSTQPTPEPATITTLTPYSVAQNAVFNCGIGFNATSYSWDFGDGTTATKRLADMPQFYDKSTDPQYYHTYGQSGNYTVSCSATDGSRSAFGSQNIEIYTPASPQEIQAALAKDSQNPYVVRFDYTDLGNQTANVSCSVIGLTNNMQGCMTYTGQDGHTVAVGCFSNGQSEEVSLPSGTYPATCKAETNNNRYAPEYYNLGHTRGCTSSSGGCVFADETKNVSIQ